MIHELLGIKNNVVEIKKNETSVDKLVISDEDDNFFSQNLINDFGDVASKVKEMIEKYEAEQTKFKSKLDTLEDIKRIAEKFSEIKKESADVTKHVNIVYELTSILQSRELLQISSLEQDMATTDNQTEQYNVKHIKEETLFISKEPENYQFG
jgi:vacuolar protein sorting-associated protein 45